TGYLMLFFTRCLVGVGEAAYGPIAPAMLWDLYPVDHRGRVMSWLYMAIPVGSALGFVIGSQVAEVLNWRWAFLVAVFPGIALGVLCFFMRDVRTADLTPQPPSLGGKGELRSSPPFPPREGGPGGLGASHTSYWAVLKEL